ncbi:MAG TPA: G1 family glutamic endopeptidase [Pseudonocardiaceae bacterium]
MGIKTLRSVAVAGLAACAVFAVLPAAAATGTMAAANSSNHVISHSKNAFQSSNWSGYAETGSFTTAVGNWTVPTVSRTSNTPNRFSSQWVGIDGFNNQNLIQTGTEADFTNGSAHYLAWWEILPAPETVIPSITVHPGNSMTASVTKVSGTTWRISIRNNSTGQSFTINRTYRGAGTSAEWIEEATSVNGQIGPPAKFSTFSFSNLTSNNANPNLNANEEIFLVQNGTTFSTPSAPNSAHNGFSVTYTGTN